MTLRHFIAVASIAFITNACATNSARTQAEKEDSTQSRFGQYININGPITEKQLLQNYPVFSVNRHHRISPKNLHQLDQINQATTIKAFFGTWCHDSQREIPELLRVMQSVNNPQLTFKLITLDHNKQDSAGLAQKAAIRYTPTIIVYQHEKELGRIVEKTPKPMAQELIDIINKE